MDVLDLGCGWGSLALYIAEKYPACRVTAMSNSRTQAEHIAAAASAAGRESVAAVTADIAAFDPGRRFDRIVSVEMFEHVRDYRELFAQLRGWLEPDGRVFVHVFSHARFAYTFNAEDPSDWMGSRFFSGGQMPAHDLFLEFDDDLVTEERWWLEGGQYARTLEDWLRRYDERAATIKPILAATYGEAATHGGWTGGSSSSPAPRRSRTAAGGNGGSHTIDSPHDDRRGRPGGDRFELQGGRL